MELKDRVVLLTGASRGIGAALAGALVQDGARVVASARTAEALMEVVAPLSNRAVGVVGDVSRDADAQAMVAAAEEHFGRLDVVVNNAAVLSPPAPVAEVSPATWAEVLSVNVIGTANVIRHALPRLPVPGGLIVNVSSTWGRVGAGRQAPYCASKFAVEGLSQSLADELPPGVAVVALNPGVIATDMLATAFEGDVSAFTSPQDLLAHWRRFFAAVDATWSGRSVDLMDC